MRYSNTEDLMHAMENGEVWILSDLPEKLKKAIKLRDSDNYDARLEEDRHPVKLIKEGDSIILVKPHPYMTSGIYQTNIANISIECSDLYCSCEVNDEDMISPIVKGMEYRTGKGIYEFNDASFKRDMVASGYLSLNEYIQYTAPFIETIWAFTGNDTEALKRIVNSFSDLYQGNRESEMIALLHILNDVLGLQFPEDTELLADHKEARQYFLFSFLLDIEDCMQNFISESTEG